MKRFIIAALIVLFAVTGLFAQQEVGGTNVQQLGIMEAQMKLKEVSVDKFEYEGFWRVSMSNDEGIPISRLFEGGPDLEKNPPIKEEEGLNISNDYVLGVRIDYLRRGVNSFLVYPQRPIPIEGIVKTVSVWVAGRNFNHRLNLILEDGFGRYFELYMGTLNFQGWKKMTVAIPPQAPDGVSGIVQRNYHFVNMMGIKVTGFRIDCDMMETYGSYFVYFDDLRAVTDLFGEDLKDKDDPSDFW